MRANVISPALVLLAAGLTLNHAAVAADGDPGRGRVAAETCLGCHGIRGYKNAYPRYSVPKLGGQRADYIAAALKEYQAGERAHLTMHANAATLSDQDIADIAAFFASLGEK